MASDPLDFYAVPPEGLIVPPWALTPVTVDDFGILADALHAHGAGGRVTGLSHVFRTLHTHGFARAQTVARTATRELRALWPNVGVDKRRVWGQSESPPRRSSADAVDRIERELTGRTTR